MRYIVKSSFGGVSHEKVWDASSPMPLGHPLRWILENTDAGVRIRKIDEGGGVNSAKICRIPNQSILHGSPVEVEGKLKVQIRELGHLHAPFQPKREPKKGASVALFVFAGARRSLMSSNAIHSAYVAYARNRPVFTAHYSSEGCLIKPLLPGVRLKYKGQPSAPVPESGAWQVRKDEITQVTVFRNWYWWRFNWVSLTEGAEIDRDPERKLGLLPGEVEDGPWLKKTAVAVLALLLLCFLISLWPVTETQKLPEQEQKITHIKLRPYRPRTQPIEQNVAKAPEPVLAPKPVPVREVKPPAQVKQVQTKPPTTHPSGGGQIKQVSKSELAAQRSQKLREMFGGAASMLANKTGGAQGKGGVPRVGELFGGKAPAFSPTEVKSKYTSSGASVGGIGGGGASMGINTGVGMGSSGGVGYAKGEKGGISGHGNSFVGMDSGGSSVEEGLTKDEVGEVIHAHMSEVRYCHEAALIGNPKTEGKLILHFSIDAMGVVEWVKVESTTLPSGGLGDCVMRRLKTWHFPRPKGGVKVAVSYPFLFKTLGRE